MRSEFSRFRSVAISCLAAMALYHVIAFAQRQDPTLPVFAARSRLLVDAGLDTFTQGLLDPKRDSSSTLFGLLADRIDEILNQSNPLYRLPEQISWSNGAFVLRYLGKDTLVTLSGTTLASVVKLPDSLADFINKRATFSIIVDSMVYSAIPQLLTVHAGATDIIVKKGQDTDHNRDSIVISVAVGTTLNQNIARWLKNDTSKVLLASTLNNWLQALRKDLNQTFVGLQDQILRTVRDVQVWAASAHIAVGYASFPGNSAQQGLDFNGVITLSWESSRHFLITGFVGRYFNKLSSESAVLPGPSWTVGVNPRWYLSSVTQLDFAIVSNCELIKQYLFAGDLMVNIHYGIVGLGGSYNHIDTKAPFSESSLIIKPSWSGFPYFRYGVRFPAHGSRTQSFQIAFPISVN